MEQKMDFAQEARVTAWWGVHATKTSPCLVVGSPTLARIMRELEGPPGDEGGEEVLLKIVDVRLHTGSEPPQEEAIGAGGTLHITTRFVCRTSSGPSLDP